MTLKKIIKYLIIVATVILATSLIIFLFYIRLAFRALVANENHYPPFISGLLNKISDRKPEPLIISKPENTIKILEGWSNQDIGSYLESQFALSKKDFLDVAGHPQIDYRNNSKFPDLEDFSATYTFLDDKPKYYGLEGYLFPDTYRVYASSTVTDIIEKMLTNFNKKLTSKMRADIKSQDKTIYEVIILASIIEKEAPINNQLGANRDAKVISGIFLNRLKNGQGLQSDATLSYIYNDNKPAHSGQELENSSPYNTYRWRGLPPGPICNPGLVAIEAAIYPIKTDYNYFLTTDKGEVIYARTYEEHLQNKYKYLK